MVEAGGVGETALLLGGEAVDAVALVFFMANPFITSMAIRSKWNMRVNREIDRCQS